MLTQPETAGPHFYTWKTVTGNFNTFTNVKGTFGAGLKCNIFAFCNSQAMTFVFSWENPALTPLSIAKLMGHQQSFLLFHRKEKDR